MDRFLPGLIEYIMARTAYFDSLFVDALSHSVPQIVLLGAGYDLRPYRFVQSNHDTKIFELDIATTQDRKMKCLKKAKIDIPRQETFVSIDFNQELLLNTLEKAGYKKHLKSLFIWEGVSYYLYPGSVDAILECFSKSTCQDSEIAFDYMVSITGDNIEVYYGAEEFFQTMKVEHSNEEMMFYIEKGKIESFLEQRNLKLIEHLDKEEIERTFLTDDDGTLLGQTAGHFRFVLAVPKEQ